MDSLAQENVSPQSSRTDCTGNNSEDCVCPDADRNGDQSNGNSVLLIGEHENQVSEGGEADLHTHYAHCKKNPGHSEFIPIESLRVEHLPEGHRDSDLFELIKATADLTVRISVTMTSPDRPEFWPGTKIPYFLTYLRGTNTFRSGTGKIRRVVKFTDEVEERDFETCPCNACLASDKPSKVWWKIEVYTAAHVVFDDIEASDTTLRLFYDTEDCPKVIIKDKVSVVKVNVEQDSCKFSCVTCDGKLGRRLKKMVKRFDDAWVKVKRKYYTSKDIHKLNFIVSHPHGCFKQVSIGQWKDKEHVKDHRYKFTYATCTCPGSSGAYVHCVGFNGWFDHIHSGCLEPRLNYSGIGYSSK